MSHIGRFIRDVCKPTDTHCAPGEPCIDGRYCAPDYGYDEDTGKCKEKPTRRESSRDKDSRSSRGDRWCGADLRD